jgi:BON domain
MRLSVHRTGLHPGPALVKNHRPPRLKAAGLTLVSAGVGAVTEFLLDPERGHARRAWIRDKAVHTAHDVNHRLVGMSRDVANRGRGVAAGTRYRIAGRWTDDAVLHDRVRAELGRYVSHPHAVQVSAQDRTVMLSGEVLAAEAERACRAISRIPGVKRLEARWTVYDEPGDVPTLQGNAKSRKA